MKQRKVTKFSELLTDYRVVTVAFSVYMNVDNEKNDNRLIRILILLSVRTGVTSQYLYT